MSNPYDVVVLADSPVSYWPLDDPTGTTATDLADSNNGTYTSGFTLGGSGPSGNFGGSTAFNGSTGYVSVTDAANLRITSTLTLEAWVFCTAYSSANFGRIISKLASNFPGYELLMASSTSSSPPANTVYFQFGNTGALANVVDTGTLPLNTWIHFVATYNGTTAILYRNGVQVASGSVGSATIASNTTNLNIGRWPGTPAGSFWTGSIAGAAVYNTVLTQSQITRHYQSGIGAKTLLDGHAAVAGNQGAGTTFPITLTTSLSNDIIVVWIYTESTSGGVKHVTGVVGGGLTWAQRSTTDNVASNSANIGVWWALAPSPLLAVTITVSLSGPTDDYVLVAFGVNGCYTLFPWDGNASLPAANITTISPLTVSVSTTQKNDFIFGMMGAVQNSLPGTPSGFTLIDGANTNAGGLDAGAAAWYQTTTSAQTGLVISSTSTGGGKILVGDALTADAPPVTGSPFLLAHF